MYQIDRFRAVVTLASENARGHIQLWLRPVNATMGSQRHKLAG